MKTRCMFVFQFEYVAFCYFQFIIDKHVIKGSAADKTF